MQLNSSKKSVKKFASVDLPEGLVRNMRVVNEEALGTIIKEVWKKVGLKEKSIGIVVPESSTFTKLLKLPKLPHGELDEAVRWQVYEYLPYKPEELILDWKLIRATKEGLEILVVAIIKEVLQGYVRSAHRAGLFPLVVETPSLSLVRLAGGENRENLVLYESFGEVIILASHGASIIASSVVSIQDHDEVVKIAARMLKHYKKTDIERIVIGGPKMNQEIAKKIQTSLGKPVSWVKQFIEGLDAAQFQEYLIPISLQLKDPAEPADQTTVNLLPPTLVKKYEGEKLKQRIWSLSLFLTLGVWISFFTALGVYIFLGQQITIIKEEDVLANIPPEKAEFIAQIKDINDISKKVFSINKVSITPQVVFNLISETKPEGISISRYRVDLESGAIQLIGMSSTRQALIAFKQALEESNDLSLVQIPISTFEKESNLEFSMDFSYLPIFPQVFSYNF